MQFNKGDFKIGAYRPIYLWGGPGTIRMNRLKFMDQPVDEAAHLEVHSEMGARRVVEELNSNWIHLMYNWGFPPEVETEDWDDFERASNIYHDYGVKVFAYIQTSNCVYAGRFREKDWYAHDRRGNKVLYYTGRYMACLTRPEWIENLKSLIYGAIERGADGIFFDNLWHGCMPISLFNTWLGPAGCQCPHCKGEYLQESGVQIPVRIDPANPDSNHYLRWRANQVTRLISKLADYTNELKPGTPVSANDYDVFMRDTYLIFGQSFPDLARIQDVVMIENFALPRWERKPKTRLVNNALTIRNALALIKESTHLSVLSYDTGIGFDPVYSPRRYCQGIAEAAACGASMTIKGTEYFNEGVHTVLTADRFNQTRETIGTYQRWLQTNSDLYQDRRNDARVGLLFPGEQLWLDWHRLAPVYFGAAQALLNAGIPWRVVYAQDEFAELDFLYTFETAALEEITIPAGIHAVRVPGLPGWSLGSTSILERTPTLRDVVSHTAHRLMNAYFNNKNARRTIERLRLHKLITQSPLFNVPSIQKQQDLLRTLPQEITPRVFTDEPVLIDVWQRDNEMQVHLVNYAPSPQTVQVRFGTHRTGVMVSPDTEAPNQFSGYEIQIPLDIYTILRITRQ